ncbi:MAG: TetR/AcrR family transcriptional regulator [Elusimicrobia bacterium]|nr:TetR/AcrR family transcriptional regulator [Elusimicrobiota bacterium]
MKVKILKQKTILEAARRVLAASDPAGATMDRIAAEAGVAKGTLFLYYPSKDALLAAVHSDLMKTFVADLESVRDSGLRGEALLRAAVKSVVEHLARKTGLMDALGEKRPGTGGGCPPQLRAKKPAVLGALKDILEKCAADGLVTLEDPLYMASALFGLCRGSFAYARGAGRTLSAGEKTDRVIAIYLDGIRRKK